MRDRTMSALSLVAIALEEAEDALRKLPYTPDTRELLGRVLAGQTVVTGLVTGVPSLSDGQVLRFVDSVMRLGREVSAHCQTFERAAS